MIRSDTVLGSSSIPARTEAWEPGTTSRWIPYLTRTYLASTLVREEPEYRDRAAHLLELVGLGEGVATRYPRELSGGMRQRVALCRALLHEPSVLLLDVPFGALDALTRERLNMDVSNLCSSWHTTVLFVTHDISEAVYMGDRVAVMAANPGRLVEIMDVPLERPRELTAKNSASFAEAVGRARQVLADTGAYDR